MRWNRRLARVGGIVLACGLATAAGASIPSDVSRKDPHPVPRASTEIVVDGRVEEGAWSRALAFELDYEVRPGENIPPPVRTELLLTYDDRNVYFAFRAHDPDPSQIRARYTDRDEAWNDDWVGIVIDTFNDQRRAYEMFSNPLGVQIDAINDEAGGRYDDSWNAIWESAGRLTDGGYEVEMAIPFNQIRFQDGGGEQVWGFDANRSYPRSDRHHIGLFPRDRSNNSYLSQTVKLVGMAGADPGTNLEIVPTLTASRTDERESVPDGPLEEADSSAQLGATLRWGLSPNVSLAGTYNPDFSQVEADAVQLDINETFALFYRETRPFFLEQADFFNTQLNLLHTRTIADPIAAGKTTGKQGQHTFGVMAARDEVTNMIFPGAEGSSGESFDVDSNSFVGRYRYDLGGSSTVGAAVTDRRGDGYSNTVISADTLYRFTDADSLEVGLAVSSTDYSDEMNEFLAGNGEPVESGSLTDHALQLNYFHGVRNWWTNFYYEDIGKDYRSDVGFRPQVDYYRWIAGGARVWWPDEGRFLNRVGWGGDVDRTATQDGDLIEEEIESWLNLQGRRESHVRVGLGRRNRVHEGVEFPQWFGSVSFNLQASRSWNFGLSIDRSDWIDFDNVREADRLAVRPRFRLNYGQHLKVELSHLYQTLDVDEGRLFRVHVPEARIVHQFNDRVFVRAILQYADIEQDPELYEDEVDAETQDLLAQLLFSYKLNAGTAFYVGYTDQQQGTDEYDLTRMGRTFFLKLSYAWLM